MATQAAVETLTAHHRRRVSLLTVLGAVLVSFTLIMSWLGIDLWRAYDKAVADALYRAMQRSQIIGQSFRSEVLASDFVIRDVLGHIQPSDLVYPDPDPAHARRMTALLKEKADTVPDFFSMVIFNHNCVFMATQSGANTGVRSKPSLCEARKQHRGTGPLVTYVPGKSSVNGHSVLVLSRNLMSESGEFLGGVMGVIELDNAQRRFAALTMEPEDSVALLDEGQVLLARQPTLDGVVGKQVAAPSYPNGLIATVSGTNVAEQTDLDGRERLLGFSKIEGFPLVVAYGFDRSQVLAEWHRRAWELGLGCAVMLALAVIAARAHWVALHQRDELMASKAALQELATRDPLTGLYNRRFLDASLPREFARAQRDGTPIAVVMLDLDHFKKVNDQYSHAAGDEVLKSLAILLKSGARDSDLVCRYGGEEFVAIMPGMAAEQAVERVEIWRQKLEETRVHFGSFSIGVTLSAGIAVFPVHGESPEQLVNRADAMLYRSKENGRNRISVYAPA